MLTDVPTVTSLSNTVLTVFTLFIEAADTMHTCSQQNVLNVSTRVFTISALVLCDILSQALAEACHMTVNEYVGVLITVVVIILLRQVL